jgi:PTH1 family peptidyl-tRNA hydrolase
LADYHRISGNDLVIIHDDIDLAFGRIKIKEKGGHGGHRGIKSLIECFGGGDFIRLRIGVGRPGPRSEAVDHVLGKFDPEETKKLPEIIERARDAVVSILCRGAKESMNVFNRKTS